MQKCLDPDTDTDTDRSGPSMRPVPAAANLAALLLSSAIGTPVLIVAKAGFRVQLHRHIATMRLPSSFKISSGLMAGDLRQSCPDGNRPC